MSASDWTVQLLLYDTREDGPVDSIEYDPDHAMCWTSVDRSFRIARLWLQDVYPSLQDMERISVFLHVTYQPTGHTRQYRITRFGGRFMVSYGGALITLDSATKVMKEDLMAEEMSKPCLTMSNGAPDG